MRNQIKNVFRNILFSILLISPLFLYLSVVSIIHVTSSHEKAPYVHFSGLNPDSEVYISWETINEESSHIRYGIAPNNLSFSFENSTQVKIHHARVSGLDAGTKYYYSNYTIYADNVSSSTSHSYNVSLELNNLEDFFFWY